MLLVKRLSQSWLWALPLQDTCPHRALNVINQTSEQDRPQAPVQQDSAVSAHPLSGRDSVTGAQRRRVCAETQAAFRVPSRAMLHVELCAARPRGRLSADRLISSPNRELPL